jgi:hypothetical protein
MVIEDFGARVASVWEGLRSTTRSLIVGALQSSGTAAMSTTTAATTTNPAPARKTNNIYDASADWELSRLLSALDERAVEAGTSLNPEQAGQLRRMAETCAAVLQDQTQSAEVFTQLVERAHRSHDYKRIDALADALSSRFAPPEVCELARNSNPVVRALAEEALAQSPMPVLMRLLADPIDMEIARDAIERQAIEYGSEDAREFVKILRLADDAEEDL